VQAVAEQVQFFKPLAPHHLVEVLVQAQQQGQTEPQILAVAVVEVRTLPMVELAVQE
jgi:hypothetical protein